MMEYTIQNDALTVRVSDAGAELQSIKSADGREYLWQGDPAYWSFRAPNLFPYIGRLTSGGYLLQGKKYRMPMHGFLVQEILTSEAYEGNSLTLRLESSEETRSLYPFDFIYRIRYALEGSTLITTTSVKNTGSGRMYFAVGGHPGFRVPLEDGQAFEDYYLEFPYPSRPDRVEFSENVYPTGTEKEYPLKDGMRIPLRHDLFAHDAIVLRHMPDTVKIGSDLGMHSVTVHYPDFPYLGFWQVWDKDVTDAPYICIEPWTSLPSRDGIIEDFTCQSDLIRLDAGKTYENTWEITIR